MKYEPWARVTTRITPKISESPLASRNRRAPYDTPLKVWVTQNSAVTGGRRVARAPPQAGQAPRGLREDAGAGPRGQVEAPPPELRPPRPAPCGTERGA